MTRRPLALVLSASALVLSACGSYADTDVKQVSKDVKSAMGDLKSVHISGDVTQEGTKVTLDVAASTSGDCTGSVKLGSMGTLEVLRADGKSYVKPDAAFWKATGGEARAAAAKGKWIASEQAFGGFAKQICDIKGLLKEINSSDDHYSKVTSSEKVDGQDVVKVAFTSKDKTKGNLFVLSDDPHYIVKADLGSDGSITFSDFNKSVKAKAPAKGDIIDASKLG